MEEERALIRKALAGDQEAFEGLVRAYQVPVYNLAYRMLGTPAEAEEAAQETFLRVYRRLQTYDVEQRLSSWVLAIASHYCVDRLRRRRGVWLSVDELPEAAVAGPVREAPEPRFLEREKQQEMQEMLACLPEGYRLAIVLRYWYDLSYEEMAEVTQTTVSAVKSRLHRAREMLAEQMTRSQARPASGRLERRLAGNALP